MVLDDTLRDLGVSAYRGANQDVGALRSFLDLVEAGRVERGSYLIVESLDRLSRQAVLDAAARLFDLIRAGVTVVTLSDGQEYSADRLRNDWTPLIVSIAIMARAHEESRIKGERVGEAWARKREKARAGTHKMTRRAPEWLSLEDGKFVLREDRVAIVRRIYAETIQGYGRRTIANRLNGEAVPAFKGAHGWHTSAIAKILGNRAVLGEFQPGTGSVRYGNHKPEGEPIRDYYPAIVDEPTFWRAQNAVRGRKQAGGRKGHGVSNLLMGLGKCARCHGPMHTVNKGKPPKGAVYLECSGARRNLGCDNAHRWRVDAIERRLLRNLSYIDADAVLRGDTVNPEADRIPILQAQLNDAEKRRNGLLRIVETGDEAAVAAFATVAAEIKSLKADLTKAKKERAAEVADPGLKARLAETIDLARAMDVAGDGERAAIRTRLAEELRRLVERIVFHHELGVVAYLRVREGVASDQVPWVFDGARNVPWQIALDHDDTPHGLEPMTPADWARLDGRGDLPSLKAAIERKRLAGKSS